jgi:FixJ family two-component response regulator
MDKKGRHCRIAIVDDEAALREATRNLLKSEGFEAESFASAEAFLRSELQDQVVCLILDVGLPGMNGLELQRRLAGNARSVRIIFITAQEDDSGRTRARAAAAGAVAFLPKPFDDRALLWAVKSSLEQEN